MHILDVGIAILVVCSDESFAGNNDDSSRGGIYNFLPEKSVTSNLIDYSGLKTREVFMSVLGAQTFVLADSCDTAIKLQHDFKKKIG